MGIQNNSKSVENEIMMMGTMSEMMGTAWWSVICVMCGFGAGLWLKSWSMNKLGR